jgi:hypothetical protein
VRKHGVVLEAGTGPVPSLAEAVAGEPIRGSWWGHPRSHEIFELTRAVRDCPDVLVCRAVGGKISFVHRRLWPALVRAAARLGRERLARVEERHSASGKHVTHETPFPRWVAADVRRAAERLPEQAALGRLGAWCQAGAKTRRR